jgi:hypothetical protein
MASPSNFFLKRGLGKTRTANYALRPLFSALKLEIVSFPSILVKLVRIRILIFWTIQFLVAKTFSTSIPILSHNGETLVDPSNCTVDPLILRNVLIP